MVDALADGVDHARSLDPGRKRQGPLIISGPVIHIDEIEADCGVLKSDFAGARLVNLGGRPLQDLRTAVTLDPNMMG